MNNFLHPEFGEPSFYCPNCMFETNQTWYASEFKPFEDVKISICSHCKKKAIWFHQKLIFPVKNIAYQHPQDSLKEIDENDNEHYSG